jgi:uncharacterized membrane protein
VAERSSVAVAIGRARALSLGLLVILILLSVVAVFADTRSATGATVLGLFMVVPALLPLRGLWRGERRVFAWATLCLTPHFLFGFTEGVANPDLRLLAVAMVLVSLALMIALVAYLRLTRGSDR